MRLFCVRNVFFVLLGAWGKVGINCFVLITGYFMCKSRISARKFLKLYFEVFFYGLVCNAVFVLSGYASFSWNMVFDSVFPFKEISSNFVVAYLIFFLLIPFLNLLVSNLSQRLHAVLAGLLLMIFSVTSVFHNYRVAIDYVEWFSVIYIVGAYLQLHGARWMDNQKIICTGLIVMLMASVASVLAFEFFIPGGYSYFLLADSNKPFAVAIAVLSFLYFRNLKLTHSRLINLIASTTFGVFLIHANSQIMRQWLWSDVCDTLAVYHSELYWLIAPLSIVAVFTCAAAIDLLRQRFIERPLLRKFHHA